MFSHPQRFLCLHTTLITRFRGVFRVNFDNVTAALPSVMFENPNKVTPPDLMRIPSVPVSLQHPLHVQIFHEHSVVLPSIKRRDLVLEVSFLVPHPFVDFGYRLSLVLPVGTTVFLSGELSLLAFRAVPVGRQVWSPDLSAVRVVNEVADTEVDPNGIFGVDFTGFWVFGLVLVNAETGVSRASPIFFGCNVFYIGVVWDWSMKADQYVDGIAVDFLEC